ncbi:hypothetical protein BpHYR1_042033 [Brachionus plicatilis]|uniref:Secreted protein n=1 Tax=Brachionus plicatilis TaxID=10195 RepID=A0A3M7PTE4_BRAPC|nr:hypothetical protein BpHYR1_042033 [Brachionus plicatilis]
MVLQSIAFPSTPIALILVLTPVSNAVAVPALSASQVIKFFHLSTIIHPFFPLDITRPIDITIGII